MLQIVVAALLVSSTPTVTTDVAQAYDCGGKKTCSKIQSCDEARFYLEQCSWGGKLDKDGDGVPCETLCGGR